MRDPVTLSTGVTYERHAIQSWLSNQRTCPVTNQSLISPELTPNLTLLSLILSWTEKPEFLLLSLNTREMGVRKKAALKELFQLCSCRKNRVKVALAGGVNSLVQLLMDEEERRICEMAMVVLEQLCGCAEGRAELMKHPAGIAVVAKKAIRVSPLTTEKAVKILHSVAKFSAREMLHVGVVSKLCLILQSDCRSKTKEQVREILRANARVWRNSPCIPRLLQASYACN